MLSLKDKEMSSMVIVLLVIAISIYVGTSDQSLVIMSLIIASVFSVAYIVVKLLYKRYAIDSKVDDYCAGCCGSSRGYPYELEGDMTPITKVRNEKEER